MGKKYRLKNKTIYTITKIKNDLYNHSLKSMCFTIREFINSKMSEELKILFPSKITKFVGTHNLRYLTPEYDYHYVKLGDFTVRNYHLSKVSTFVRTLYYLSNQLVRTIYDIVTNKNDYIHKVLFYIGKTIIPKDIVRYIILFIGNDDDKNDYMKSFNYFLLREQREIR
jgi:hypothetical protein